MIHLLVLTSSLLRHNSMLYKGQQTKWQRKCVIQLLVLTSSLLRHNSMLYNASTSTIRSFISELHLRREGVIPSSDMYVLISYIEDHMQE